MLADAARRRGAIGSARRDRVARNRATQPTLDTPRVLEVADVVALMDEEERYTLAALRAAAPRLPAPPSTLQPFTRRAGASCCSARARAGGSPLARSPSCRRRSASHPSDSWRSGPAGARSGAPRSRRRRTTSRRRRGRFAIWASAPSDGVIGLAASGTTPFVLAGIDAANDAGSWTCGIANNAGTPLLDRAALGILLDTGPEVLCGSTRLKAGTAQKLALNRITTAAMVGCGRVIENHMVDVVVTIDKLRARAVRIVADLARISPDRARALLDDHDWSVRAALTATEDPQSGDRP